MVGVRSIGTNALCGAGKSTRPVWRRRLLILTALAGALTAWRNTMLAINERRYGPALIPQTATNSPAPGPK
jgi:hypothetical protein